MNKLIIILSALALTATAQDINTRLDNLEKKVFGEGQVKPIVAVTPTEEMLKVQSDAELAQKIQRLRQRQEREVAFTNSLRDPSKRTNALSAELLAKIRKQRDENKAAAASASAQAKNADAGAASQPIEIPAVRAKTNAPAGKGK